MRNARLSSSSWNGMKPTMPRARKMPTTEPKSICATGSRRFPMKSPHSSHASEETEPGALVDRTLRVDSLFLDAGIDRILGTFVETGEDRIIDLLLGDKVHHD